MTHDFETGDQVECSYAGTNNRGTYITERDGKAVIKLENGYNIGIDASFCTFAARPAGPSPSRTRIMQDESLPELSIISTGGTIASRIDYRTGAVTSQFDAEDILRAVPGLRGIARFRSMCLATILSENMKPAIWQELARAIHSEIKNGAEGVIVTHGTDTMAYSASAISFMVETPVPVIFVGSQRSADRPSSDNAMNALCSASAARSDLGEVAVVMHATTNDDFAAVHRGTRVRKMHTSRRDAFRSIGMEPVGYVDYPSLDVRFSCEAVRRGTNEPALHDNIEEKVGFLQYSPGLPSAVLDAFCGYRGLVISGTGLGHVSSEWIPDLKRLADEGASIVMTSQCLNGRICDRVYDTGRDLLGAGVIEGEDMLPEAALVKLMWVLGQTDERELIAEMMQSDLRGEIRRRSYGGN